MVQDDFYPAAESAPRQKVSTISKQFTAKSALYPKGEEPLAYAANQLLTIHWAAGGSKVSADFSCRSDACALKLSSAFGKISNDLAEHGHDFDITSHLGQNQITIGIPKDKFELMQTWATAKTTGAKLADLLSAEPSLAR